MATHRLYFFTLNSCKISQVVIILKGSNGIGRIHFMKKSKIIIISAIIVAIIGIFIAKQCLGDLHEHDENCGHIHVVNDSF